MASDMSVAAPTYRAADMNLPLSTVEASSHTVSDLLGDFSYNQSQIHADIRALWQILRDEQSAPWIHWCNEGRSFCLVDDSEFVKGRLRFFFKKVTFRSFLRKFVNLGFTESLILPTPTDPRVWSVLTVSQDHAIVCVTPLGVLSGGMGRLRVVGVEQVVLRYKIAIALSLQGALYEPSFPVMNVLHIVDAQLGSWSFLCARANYFLCLVL